jgi:hypothetical protein
MEGRREELHALVHVYIGVSLCVRYCKTTWKASVFYLHSVLTQSSFSFLFLCCSLTFHFKVMFLGAKKSYDPDKTVCCVCHSSPSYFQTIYPWGIFPQPRSQPSLHLPPKYTPPVEVKFAYIIAYNAYMHLSVHVHMNIGCNDRDVQLFIDSLVPPRLHN